MTWTYRQSSDAIRHNGEMIASPPQQNQSASKAASPWTVKCGFGSPKAATMYCWLQRNHGAIGTVSLLGTAGRSYRAQGGIDAVKREPPSRRTHGGP